MNKNDKRALLLPVLACFVLISTAINATEIHNTGSSIEEPFMILSRAISNGDLTTIKLMLDSGYSPNLKNRDGKTLLHIAIFHKRTDIVKLLLDRGGDINAQSNTGMSALMLAAALCYTSTFYALLERSPDLGIKDGLGETVLFKASAYCHDDLVKALISRGTEVKTQSDDGSTALHRARNNVNTIEILLVAGADINAVNKYGRTPLMEAVSDGLLEKAKTLIDRGANINARDEEGKTALMLAKEMPWNSMIEILRQAGAKE